MRTHRKRATNKAWVPALKVNSIQGGLLSGRSEKRPLWGTADPITVPFWSKHRIRVKRLRVTDSGANPQPDPNIILQHNTSAASLHDQGQFLVAFVRY
jgi:hypothetical protein